MKKTQIYVVLGVILVAVLAWMLYEGRPVSGTEAHAKEEARERPGAALASAVKDVKSTAKKVAKDRLEVRGKGTLRLSILGPDGVTVPGKVYWMTSAEAPTTSSLMAPEHGYPLPASGVQHLHHEGEARLEIPAGHWTWLRVTGEKGWFASRYERVAPFSGEQDMQLQLSPDKRRIHVFVVQDDLTTPAGHVPIRLLTATMDAPGKHKPAASRKTDTWGYVYFDQLDPGSFLVLAPGAGQNAKMPYTQRVLLPPNVAMTEIALTLVVPEERVSIRLDVHASLAKVPQLPPKIYLKRQDDHLGELYPMKGVLVPGEQKLSFELPRGKYEIGVLPLGRVGIDAGQKIIDVEEDGQVFPVRLVGRRPMKEIKLVGLSRNDYPVTVFPRTRTPLLDDEFALMFCGPYKWHLATQVTALPDIICDLVVTGRAGYWLSKGPTSLAGSKFEVALQPATQVKVTWKRFPPGEGTKALLHVRTRGSEFYRVMSRRFAPEGGRMDPAFVATLIVPRGPVTIECRKKDGGIHWRRVIQARETRQVLSVDGR